MSGTLTSLTAKMLQPDFYPHPVEQVELIETHVSLIFLAGDFAYKLKKPLNLGFLDYSSLEKRHLFCLEELRLNRRFSPQLYLDVCQVGGPPEDLRLGGEPAVDYLVQMRRFPCRAQLDRLLQAGGLGAEQLDAFADLIADFHRQATVAEASSDFGRPGAVLAPVAENFTQLAPLLTDSAMRKRLLELQSWSEEAGQRLRPVLQQRKATGCIRECHGDLHLANMIWWQERPFLFDCIEFNPNLRWIDPISEAAFLAMDLDDRGEPTLAWSFLNRYLQQSGDYPGLQLLSFYKVYRALVRAKVACLRLQQPGLDAEEENQDRELIESYLDLAAGYLRPRPPQLLICHGLSGSGKTSFVSKLAPLCKAIRIHSDVERKRLAGLAATASSGSAARGGIYSSEATVATYQHLAQLAESILRSGLTVIVDATFLQQHWRSEFRQLAEQHGAPFRILDFSVPEAELRRRIHQRQDQPNQFSEATEEILDLQLARREPLTETERAVRIRVAVDSSVRQIAEQLMLS